MAMPKKTGIIFVTVGAVLMLSALLLFFYNKHEEYRAGQEAELLMDDIQSVISEQEEPVMPSSEIEKDASETEAETSENTEQVETLPAELSKVMQVFH